MHTIPTSSPYPHPVGDARSCVLTFAFNPVINTFVALQPDMQNPDMHSKSITITAVLTVMAVVCAQFFCYQAKSFEKKEVRTEQQESQPEDQLFVSLQSSSMPSSSLLVLNQVMVLLFEIGIEKRESSPIRFTIFIPPNRFFKTLFDSVISPNAP